MSTSLSSLLADANQLNAAIQTAEQKGDWESAESAQHFLDTVIYPAIKEKPDALAYMIQVKLPAVAAERKAYLETVQDWARQPEQEIKGIKAYLKALWKSGAIEGDSISGHQHTIDFSVMTRPTIDVDQQTAEQDWSPEMQKAYGEIRVEFKPIKANIEAALKQGKSLPPGIDVTYSTRLSIKMKK